MRVFVANELLSGAVRAMVIVEMARALLARRADLASDTSITFHLAQAGFGQPSIRALHHRARQVAAMVSAPTPMEGHKQ